MNSVWSRINELKEEKPDQIFLFKTKRRLNRIVSGPMEAPMTLLHTVDVEVAR